MKAAKKANGKPRAQSNRSGHGKTLKKARGISPGVSQHLCVLAGGRCQFDGCNKFLLKHTVTSAIGNFAQKAHIYAFSIGGPRGGSSRRPREINGIANLMLLCGECHHLIDKVEPEKYPVEVLKKFKADHEKRIHRLTGIANDRGIIPLVLKAPIAGRTMEISDDEMQHAAVPNYIRDDERVLIDLSGIPDADDPAYYRIAVSAVDAQVEALGRRSAGKSGARKVGVFALASIPILVHLGSRLSDKWTIDLYQRRRVDENPWTWEVGEGVSQFNHRELVTGSAGIALLINVSGTNRPAAFGSHGAKWSFYELSLEGDNPNPMAIKTRGDLERFKIAYIRTLATIRNTHPDASEMHVLAAVPAPAAIILGRERLPKVDPALIVYDRDNRTSELRAALSIGV